MKGIASPALGIVLLLGACAPYRPATLNPVASAAAFRSRTLPAALNLEALTTAALGAHPDLDIARAQAASAEAALQTARQRINPGLTAEGGYNRTPDSVATYAVSPAFTIETAGKRGYRILEAEKRAEAARIGVYEAMWQVRSKVRAAFVAYGFAVQKLARAKREAAVHREIVAMFEVRVAVGESGSAELSAARADQSSAAINESDAEGDLARATAALATAAGVPLDALDGTALNMAALEVLPTPESLPLLNVQKAGLLHRGDVRRALVEYEAADAHLRLALANRYPNIVLNPAYTFQEGFPAYTLGSVLESLPVFHRNAGPIAEAEAARHVEETRFVALQGRVVVDTEAARREYSEEFAEWMTASAAVDLVAAPREAALAAGLKAGQNDRMEMARARLLTLAAISVREDALQRAQSALGSLQDAVQGVLP